MKIRNTIFTPRDYSLTTFFKGEIVSVHCNDVESEFHMATVLRKKLNLKVLGGTIHS